MMRDKNGILITWPWDLAVICLLFIMASCSTAPRVGPDITPFSSQPTQGMTQKQNNKIVPYQDSKGWICHPPEDYEKLLLWCKSVEGK